MLIEADSSELLYSFWNSDCEFDGMSFKAGDFQEELTNCFCKIYIKKQTATKNN